MAKDKRVEDGGLPILEAGGLVIKDAGGAVRGNLGLDGRGLVHLELCAGDGEPCIRAGVDANGDTALAVLIGPHGEGMPLSVHADRGGGCEIIQGMTSDELGAVRESA